MNQQATFKSTLHETVLSRDSILCRHASMLQGAKLDLFVACYQAMRVVDDLADENRSLEVSCMQAWLNQIGYLFKHGSVPPQSTIPGPLDEITMQLMADTLPESIISRVPFERFAAAMEHDAQDKELESYDDLMRYTEGASVAPTYIYLRLLGSDEAAKNDLCSFKTEQWWRFAQPLGRFCYLVHIKRDLIEDAVKGPHLLTVPSVWYEGLARNRTELAHMLKNKEKKAIMTLYHELDERITAMAAGVKHVSGFLYERMPSGQGSHIVEIIEHYENLNEKLVAD